MKYLEFIERKIDIAPEIGIVDFERMINYSVRRAYHFRKMGITHLGEVLG